MVRRNVSFILLLLFAQALAADIVKNSDAESSNAVELDERPPNIVLIVIDDLGYTDLGSYGGEIRTPNLDQLAGRGMRFTDFYVSPNCAPTRSMLLSGLDHHISGNGTMLEHVTPGQVGRPGYEGYLNANVTPLPQLLRDSGYEAFMVGKWHLGLTEEASPQNVGFKKSFALLLGGGSHFSDRAGLVSEFPLAPYREDGKPIDTLPDDFYSTNFYTDKTIEYLSRHRDNNKPFFTYMSFTAPHWPLQAPDHALNLYENAYYHGYDALRVQRIRRASELGIINTDPTSYSYFEAAPPWTELTDEEKKVQSRKMEIYAAMIDLVDQNVGRFLDYLRSEGEFENTVFIVMSDNGAEGNKRFRIGGDDWVEKTFDHSFEAMGRSGSYVYLGPGWAQASTGPFRLWKAHTTEGGIRAPLIISGPGLSNNGEVDHSVRSVLDLYPTIVELAGADASALDESPYPLQGKSMVAKLTGAEEKNAIAHTNLGWEIFGGKALREGDWKIVWVAGPNGPAKWQLYNLADDPGEMVDLAVDEAQHLARLVQLWQDYAQDSGVVLPEAPVHGAWGDID